MSARRGRVFWTATGLIGLDTILFTMVVPALPGFQDRHGFSDAVGALIFAAFPVAQLLAALGAAGLVDRAGRRPVMVMAVVMLTAATLGFALADSPGLLAAARAVQGLAAGLVWTAALAAISDVYPSSELGLRIGLAETAGGALGLVGPLAGGLLIDAVGLDEAFLLAAILPALAVVPTLLVPETRRPGHGAPPRLLPALARLGRVREARVAVAALALVAGTLALLEPLLPLDLDERLGLSSTAVGLVFAAGLLAHFTLLPVAGRWSDRRGRRGPLLVGGLLMAAGLPLVGVGPAWSVAIAFAVVGAGMAALAAPTGPLMVESVDRAGMAGSYGLSSAVLTVVFAAGYTAGPLLGAGASALLPFTATVALAAALALVVAVLAARGLPPEQADEPALATRPKGG
ncbi:MFS transporter [Miltoncostaea marina]|uniref:MFS transporter n=1 Tax=Miltoncostaea marina TaxID=2843215 RepID=UPI001C3E0184|nr:MFS transporter [Miltoncostaea marina]